MTSTISPPVTPDVTALIAAVARNTEAGGLRKFLQLHRWKVLADYIRPVTHKRGELVIGQGELDRKLYFVESGDLKVDMHTDKGIVHLAIVGPGSVVGEGSFFSHLPRIAAVSAYSDCKIWILTPEEFERLSHTNANVALAVSMALGTLMATRMLDMSKRITVL
ncbi:MAG: cyclic nucleotide-binding domain-containing protein [Pseudomonadota bacterium]